MPIDSDLLARLKKNDSSLTKVNLEYSEINDKDIEKLVEALAQNTVIIKLYLSNNRFGEQGIKSLAKWLSQNHSLLILDIGKNKLRLKCNEISL